MKNLEQIRAAAALNTASKTTKAEVNKLPGMIIANGLMAATAFAKEASKDGIPKRSGMKAAMDGAAEHLAEQGIVPECSDSDALVKRLTEVSSAALQEATAEALAFLGYVKRFAAKADGEGQPKNT